MQNDQNNKIIIVIYNNLKVVIKKVMLKEAMIKMLT